MKSLRLTIQMKATEHYFPVVLFVMLYTEVLIFEKRIYSNKRRPESSPPSNKRRVWDKKKELISAAPE